jgi:hypothetical protein
MKPTTGFALLLWALVSAAMAFLSSAIGNDAHSLIQKGMTLPMNAALEGKAIDENKLEQVCLAQNLDPPKRAADGHLDLWSLVDWAQGGSSDLVRRMMEPFTIAWTVGAALSAVCGISCLRRHIGAKPPAPPIRKHPGPT